MISWLAVFQSELLAQGFHPEHVARIVHLYETGHTLRAKRLTRPICGARKKDGTLCYGRPLPNGRCKHHGGLSTGSKTPEGRERQRQATLRFWEKWRATPPGERTPRGPRTPEGKERIRQAAIRRWERERIRQAAEELPEELR